jgi:hypothetical protein
MGILVVWKASYTNLISRDERDKRAIPSNNRVRVAKLVSSTRLAGFGRSRMQSYSIICLQILGINRGDHGAGMRLVKSHIEDE